MTDARVLVGRCLVQGTPGLPEATVAAVDVARKRQQVGTGDNSLRAFRIVHIQVEGYPVDIFRLAG